MKKLLPVVLIAASFALIGCSSQKTSKMTDLQSTRVTQQEKGKKCHHHGKLGEEKIVHDTSK